jgi:murein DD-endopeptidase MepM/ murein hydrolase activator NlpD
MEAASLTRQTTRSKPRRRNGRDASDALKDYDGAVKLTQTEIDYHKDKISGLKDQYTELTDAIKAQQEALEGHRHTKLQGETALDNQIAAAELRVKQQQLAIAEAERGGAGKKRLEQMNKELDALRNQADILRLQKETTFDVQHSQLAQQGVTVNEESFDQAKQNIINTQAWLDQLQGRVPAVKADLDTEEARLKDAEGRLKAGEANRDQQKAIVADQQAALENLKLTRDKINDSYAAEKDHLATLKDSYKTAKDEAIAPFEDALKRVNDQIERTKLIEQLDLGPAKHQVDDLLKPIKEMSADEIAAGLKATGDEVARIQALLDKAGENGPVTTGVGGTSPDGAATGAPVDTTHDANMSGPTGVAGGMQAFKDFGKAVDDAKVALSGFSDWMHTYFPGLSEGPKGLTSDMKETRDTTHLTTAQMTTDLKAFGDYMADGMNKNQENANGWGVWMRDHWGPSIKDTFDTVDTNFTHLVTVSMPALWTTLKTDATSTGDEISAKFKNLWDEKNQGGILGSWITGLGTLSTKFNGWLNDATAKDSWLVKGLSAWGDVMVTAWNDGLTAAWPKFTTFMGQQFASLANLLPAWAKQMFGITSGSTPGAGGTGDGSQFGGGTGDTSQFGGTGYSAQAIDAVLAKAGSPLTGQGQFIIEMSQKYGIPVEIALAMWKVEGDYGRLGAAATNKNPGNLRDSNFAAGTNGGFALFDSWKAGIEGFFDLLRNNTHGYDADVDKYKQGDVSAILDLIKTYAPAGDNNNPQTYYDSVKDMIKQLLAIITGGSSAGTPTSALTRNRGSVGQPGDPILSDQAVDKVVRGGKENDTYSAWRDYNNNGRNDAGELHAGLDIGGTAGMDVTAPVGGHVVFAGPNKWGGTAVIIENDQGQQWYYGHLRGDIGVKVGQDVTAGQVIGHIDPAFNHVHVQEKVNGQLVDPTQTLEDLAAAIGEGPGQEDLRALIAYIEAMGKAGATYDDLYPKLPKLTDGISDLLPNLANLIQAVTGVDDATAAASDNIVVATDAILDHIGYKTKQGDADHLGYLNQNGGLSAAADNMTRIGGNMSIAGPSYGDAITTGQGAGMGFGDGWHDGITTITPDVEASTQAMLTGLQDTVLLPWQDATREFFGSAGFGFAGAVADGMRSASGDLADAAARAGRAAGSSLEAGLNGSVPAAVAALESVKKALDAIQSKDVTVTVHTVYDDAKTKGISGGVEQIGFDESRGIR